MILFENFLSNTNVQNLSFFFFVVIRRSRLTWVCGKVTGYCPISHHLHYTLLYDRICLYGFRSQDLKPDSRDDSLTIELTICVNFKFIVGREHSYTEVTTVCKNEAEPGAWIHLIRESWTKRKISYPTFLFTWKIKK